LRESLLGLPNGRMFLAAKRGNSMSGAPVGAALCFAAGLAAGLAAGALIASGSVLSKGEPVAIPAPVIAPPNAALRSGHPAEVLRVFDGDTFEARVHVWPGMDITTRVRLRGIDAPEMTARCADERNKAEAARNALQRMLNEGSVAVSRIGQDKYGGRVDADVSTARTGDVSAALVERGLVRRYSGGKREGWCG
jgi:endonuclease YncB( thermonuclease family)